MKCDLCEKEATVHEWTKKAGHKIEKHLCEECARKQGVAIQPQQQISQLITKLIGTVPAGGTPSQPGTAPAAAATQANTCPTCGTTYAQFRHSGLLGCPACYAVFETQLGPLLQRAHEGGTHHAGKVPHAPTLHHSPRPSAPPVGPPVRPTPARAPGPVSAGGHTVTVIGPPVPGVPDPIAEAARAEVVKRLRVQLAEAIAAEQYERAAKIRDELARVDPSLSKQGPPTPPAGPPSPS